MPQVDRLALQLYSLRTLKEPFADVLRSVAEAGYAGVETVGDHGLDSGEMNDLLAEHGLEVCSSHVGLAALEADVASISRFNRDVGNDVLVVPGLPASLYDDTKESWLAIGRRLGELARRCQDEGARLLFHNHDFEMQKIDGRLALDWLMDGAEGMPLGLEPDLAWVVRGGRDPLELLEHYEGRCPRVHVKDIAPEGQNVDEDGWSDVGQGTLDWSRLLAAARDAGVEWFVVEHDKPKDPLGFVQRSAAFLENEL